MKQQEEKDLTEPPSHEEVVEPARPKRGRLVLLSIWAIVLLAAALAAATFLASSVPTAPFRLHAMTTVVELTVTADIKMVVRAARWRAVSAEAPTSGGIASLKRGDGSSADFIELWLGAGDAVSVRRIDGYLSQYLFSASGKAFQMAVQLATDTTIVATRTAVETPLRLTVDSSPIQMQAGQLQISIDGTTGWDGVLALRTRVSALRFGRVQRDGVEPGLMSGGLQFLDKPEQELAIYRGSDLRLGDEIDGEVSSMLLGPQGIEVSASGLARDVRLHVATQDHDLADHSFMPSWYDRLKGRPLVIGLIGFVGSVVATLSLLLSLGRVSPAIEKWLKFHFG